jgi:hypothetical protein
MADDFSEQVRKALALRVGSHCSNPDCRVLTSGPQEDPAKAVNLGVGAHITAASPGGPRFDAELIPEERCSPTNGIWLCTTVVDRGFRREPGASAPGKSANFEGLQGRAFAPFLRQEASTAVVLILQL